MTAPAECLFCRIVAGDVPSRRIHEDEHAIAFLDISPWHRGHTLVIPRAHLDDLLDGDAAITGLGPTLDAVSRLLVDRLRADGLNLLSSARAVAGQEVFHLHVHLIPRYAESAGLAGLVHRSEAGDAELDAVWRQVTGGAG